MLHHRATHYTALFIILLLLTIPSIGQHSLWDVDEGVNAEASREMMENGTWITPTFNYQLRTAKPVMLYWLQMTSYSFLGVSEFSARLPSVLAAIVTVLLTYELGRFMFGAGVGFLAGVVLASCIEFCMLAHAATPDSTLLMFSMLTMLCFWRGSANGGRSWFLPTAIASAGAVLTKGPVGVVLPGVIILAYFAWNRELSRLWDRRLIWASFAFLAIAAPWYVLVSLETRGAFASQFFGRENVTRFLQPMENHRGPIFYHLVGMLVFFTPWSIFLAATFWYNIRSSRTAEKAVSPTDDQRSNRFLLCWVGAYLFFFSIAQTKLPNYVLPLYPALAILTARFLVSWRTGWIHPARWVMPAGLTALGCIGIATIIGLHIAGGAIAIPFGKMRIFPGAERWAMIGLIPLLGSLLAAWFLWKQQRTAVLTTVAIAAVAYLGVLGAGPVVDFDRAKAPRALIAEAGACQPDQEIRLASYAWFQPSLVFYAQREVKKFDDPRGMLEYLRLGLPVFVFVPELEWERVKRDIPDVPPHRQVARRYDFLKNCQILVITNQ